MDVVQRVAAKAVIMHKGKVLLLREAATYEEGTNLGRYHFPGGRIDPNEKFYDALKREVKEETGLKIKADQPIFVGEWFPVIKDVKNHIVAIFMLCDAVTTKVKLSTEHDDFKWINPNQPASIDVMPPDDKVLKKAAEALK